VGHRNALRPTGVVRRDAGHSQLSEDYDPSVAKQRTAVARRWPPWLLNRSKASSLHGCLAGECGRKYLRIGRIWRVVWSLSRDSLSVRSESMQIQTPPARSSSPNPGLLVLPLSAVIRGSDMLAPGPCKEDGLNRALGGSLISAPLDFGQQTKRHC
jgi:hypothetical protein